MGERDPADPTLAGPETSPDLSNPDKSSEEGGGRGQTRTEPVQPAR